MTDLMRRVLPVYAVLLAVAGVWYPAAMWLNYEGAANLADGGAGTREVWLSTLRLVRPVLPAPHQIAGEVLTGLFGYPVTSARSLAYHAGVTAAAALCGFAIAVLLGIALAVCIVHVRTLDRAVMPWVIASQTVPVLAIAPMVVIVLGNAGLTGLLPKALIAGWLSFFPITVAMIVGVRAPDPMQLDLMRTYAASGTQVFTRLRWPASMPFLFPALKVASALALVGAIVAELPTGAQAGLGARLLAGSYYGQTLQIWAALFTAAALSLLATGGIELARACLARAWGGRL